MVYKHEIKPVSMSLNRFAPNHPALKKSSLLVAVLLTLVTAVIYGSVVKHDFDYYDDESYITANAHIQKGLSWTSIKWAFTSIGYSDNWHPLTWLSHLLDVQLFGLNPAGHHFTNLFLHILATLLLFGFLVSATGSLWPSALVAALFALHPLHVESVAWVAERKDVLCAVFWCATLWVYGYYARRPSGKKYVLVFILFAFGLMAKPMCVTLPFILLLLDYWPLERLTLNCRSIGRLAAEKLPLVLLTIASSIVTIIAQHRAIGSFQKSPLVIRAANAILSYCVYLGQALWPMKLSVFYPYPLPQPLPTILCLLMLTAITAVVIAAGRKKKYLLTGWMWYIVSLVPVIGIVQVGSQPHADRYTYIPLIGIFIMIAWGFYAIAASMSRRKKTLVNIILLIIVSVMAIKTREQIGYWKNGITLFTHCFEVTKGNVNENAYYNFGNLLSQAGRTDEAVFYYRKALELNPNQAETHNNLALLLEDMGQTEEAITHFVKAVEHDPKVEAYNNLGTLLAKSGRTDEAAINFQKALAMNPDYMDAHFNFGILLAETGRNDEAVAHYRKALEIDPNDYGANYNLGLLFTKMGRTDDAIVHYRKALEITPEAVGPLQNLAFAYVQNGQLTEATSVVQKALASARFSGNEDRIRTVEQLLAKLDETINVLQGHTNADQSR
jgi:tetratricopeptide (TPR) repeat protein